MAKEITVTKVDVYSRTGPNLAPHGGYVTFSDGKCYGFGREMVPNVDKCEGDNLPAYVAGEGFTFYASRKRDAITEQVSFSSPKRSAALVQFFNNQ